MLKGQGHSYLVCPILISAIPQNANKLQHHWLAEALDLCVVSSFTLKTVIIIWKYNLHSTDL